MRKIKIKLNKKFLILISILALLLLIFVGIFRVKIFTFINNKTAEFAYNHATPFTHKIWQIASSMPFIDTSKKAEVVYFETETKEPIEFQNETKTDDNLIENVEYTIKGEEGTNTFKLNNLKITSPFRNDLKIVTKDLSNTVNPISEITYKGSKSDKDFKADVDKIFKEANASFIKADNNIKSTKVPITAKYDAKLIKNNIISRIDILKDTKENTNSKDLTIARAQILYKDCNYFIENDIAYNLEEKTYKFDNLNNYLKFLCDGSMKNPSIVQMATCDDCNLYPADKTRRLAKTYNPPVKSLTSVQKGIDFKIHEDAYNDFLAMFAAIKKAGHNVNITSAYRSYANQEETFKYWKDREIRLFGVDEATAIVRANKFSAMPGFSEHQLGTTVDLNVLDCEAFDGFCQKNENMWDWLSANAYKYGFVQSYPNGREVETGYVAERWHYRWLGKEIATQYIVSKQKLTLNNWLYQYRLF